MAAKTEQNHLTSEQPDTLSLANICKAASDSMRLSVIRLLSRDSFGVQELAGIFAMPQPGMSHHLKVLTTAGLLSSRRQGNSIFYRRALLSEADTFFEFKQNLFASIDALPLSDEIIGRVYSINEERAEQSRQFFERNAEKFAEKQGKLCDLSQYLSNIVEMLSASETSSRASALEVGPGQGELLLALSYSFGQVLALDDSEEMLSLAKERLKGKSDNIAYKWGALESLDPSSGPFDMIVLNMVLHHMASPAAAFNKLNNLLAPGGSLIIADLCSHDQEWTKESCGDLWLGFDPEELSSWAGDSGLTKLQSQFLGLKNGFQIQLAQFHKEIF